MIQTHDPDPVQMPRSAGELSRMRVQVEEAESRMESSSASGSCSTDRFSRAPLLELPLHESELRDSKVREQHEEQEQPIFSKQALRPFVFPCLVAACIFSFLLALVVIILAALLQQKKCSSNGAAMRLEPCPLDWLYNGRTCYYFSKEREDWNQSQLFCSIHNSSLALINSQSELNFLVELTCEHHNWIGLRRRGDTFEWANGTTCHSTLCSITDFGECAYIEDAAVRVSGCSLTRPYICTRKPFVGT